MKNILLIIPLLIFHLSVSQAQDRYLLENSFVRFFSDGIVEDIEATNKDAKGIIDFSKNEFLIKIPIKSFKFASALMQEHFNENYMESDKFPEGTFKGKIEGSYELGKNGIYQVNTIGDLTIHGVTKPRNIPAFIYVKDGKIALESKFMIRVAEHKIKIPSIVIRNIAEEVEVTIKSDLKKYDKQ
ncbi:YceI family protein [Thermoflexibacter ruber]|uniref:YceI-like domain-containing protein n=1 Tax=Thermoflexibacter ruber TaxID=1003 RepID=A0A1I2JS13_9BACT|nr:YceI family protein [Thermoflexibacter ruber]SFF57592.1 YceI-like domain-containing protein [Thermoflexibacter ruber]